MASKLAEYKAVFRFRGSTPTPLDQSLEAICWTMLARTSRAGRDILAPLVLRIWSGISYCHRTSVILTQPDSGSRDFLDFLHTGRSGAIHLQYLGWL